MAEEEEDPFFHAPTQQALRRFVEESNLIEGIVRPPTDKEIAAHWFLLKLPELCVDDLCTFVTVVQPDAVLRTQLGLDVQVGHHVAPPGGYAVRAELAELLREANHRRRMSCYEVGCAYQHLHPFTDGNGRSGRALWLWQMTRRSVHYPRGAYRAGVSFLHEWYYQSLAHHDRLVRQNQKETVT